MKLKEDMAQKWYLEQEANLSTFIETRGQCFKAYLAGFEAALELAATTCEKAQKESGEAMCLLNWDRLAPGLRKIGETSDET